MPVQQNVDSEEHEPRITADSGTFQPNNSDRLHNYVENQGKENIEAQVCISKLNGFFLVYYNKQIIYRSTAELTC